MPAPVTMAACRPTAFKALCVSFTCVHRAGDLRAALARLAHVLGRAVIGLQAGKAQMRRARDRLGDARRRRARLRAAAPPADVDLHQHVERSRPPSPRRASISATLSASSTHTAIRGAARQRGQPVELARARHLVGDEHVADAAGDHHLGLRHLLAAHPDRAERHLPGGNDRATCASWSAGAGARRHGARTRPCAAGCARRRRDRRASAGVSTSASVMPTAAGGGRGMIGSCSLRDHPLHRRADATIDKPRPQVIRRRGRSRRMRCLLANSRPSRSQR